MKAGVLSTRHLFVHASKYVPSHVPTNAPTVKAEAHRPNACRQIRSHSGCAMDSAFEEKPVRTHPSVIESPRKASLAWEPAAELADRTCAW
jgi:hypothetical protein